MPQLPALGFNPQNALLDVSGFSNALSDITAQRNKDREFAMQEERLSMAKQSHSASMARGQKNDRLSTVKMIGGWAQQADAEQDPMKRQAMWQRIKNFDPDAANDLRSLGIDPDDHVNGPKAVIGLLQGYQDPQAQEMKRLQVENQRAALDLTRARAANVGRGGGADYGKSGTVVKGADGKFYSVQFGSGGKKLIEPLAIGETAMTPARGVGIAGDQMYDEATGAPIRDIAPNLAGGERAKVVGRESGEMQAGLPKAGRALEMYEKQGELIDGEIARSKTLAKGAFATGFVGAGARHVPGTPAYDLARRLDTIKANIGFDRLDEMRQNSPTGGALGQVAVQELVALQSVIGSLDQAQSEAALSQSLDQVAAIRKKFRQLRRAAYEQDVKRFGAAAVPNPETGAAPSQPQNDYKSRYGLD